jgi:uncharacterized membrane protein YhaH (DUF805 family)
MRYLKSYVLNIGIHVYLYYIRIDKKNMNWYLKVFRQYSDFSGRARRKEYWMFVLFNVLFSFIALIMDNMLGLASPEKGYGIIYGLYILVILIPGFAVSTRRLHDVGKSGWMLLIVFIPFGALWLLFLLGADGEEGANKWGDSPKNYISEND